MKARGRQKGNICKLVFHTNFATAGGTRIFKIIIILEWLNVAEGYSIFLNNINIHITD